MAMNMLERSKISEYDARGGWHMTEHEKFEQVGRLAEEVSRLKGEVNHINEKLTHAFQAYQVMIQGSNPANWKVENGKLIVSPQPGRPIGQPSVNLGALLGEHELIEVLEKRQNLTTELNHATTRLRSLAPHLL
jgi:hypothetical protein